MGISPLFAFSKTKVDAARFLDARGDEKQIINLEQPYQTCDFPAKYNPDMSSGGVARQVWCVGWHHAGGPQCDGDVHVGPAAGRIRQQCQGHPVL